jgi:hypothetical protein
MSATSLSKLAPEGGDGEQTRAWTSRIRGYAARMNRLIGVSLEADVVDRTVVAEFDRDRISQVLANLVAEATAFASREREPAGSRRRQPQ